MILHFTTSKIWKLESDFRLESKRVELLIIWVFCDMIAIYKSFTICCVFAFNRVGVHAGAGDDEKTSANLAGPKKRSKLIQAICPADGESWMDAFADQKKKTSLGQLFHSQAPLLSSLKEESIDCLQLSVSRVAHVCPSEMTGGWRSVDMEITFIGLYIVDGWGSTVIVYCCACCCYLSFILFCVPFVLLCFAFFPFSFS